MESYQGFDNCSRVFYVKKIIFSLSFLPGRRHLILQIFIFCLFRTEGSSVISENNWSCWKYFCLDSNGHSWGRETAAALRLGLIFSSVRNTEHMWDGRCLRCEMWECYNSQQPHTTPQFKLPSAGRVPYNTQSLVSANPGHIEWSHSENN